MSAIPAEDLLASQMQQVDLLIKNQLDSDVVLISQLGNYITSAGGKRLRPRVTLLSALAAGYQGDDHVRLATIIEFIHTATLLHDDVVDESNLRRGRETANNIWGNGASVLTGDFIYSRAFQLIVQTGSIEIMGILADATNTIAEGEVMQLMNQHNPDLTEQDYLEVIHRKTAVLFEAGMHIGALQGNLDSALTDALRDYGSHLGMAFQLIDDALDYASSSEQLGKNIGDDLAEGKITLPLIHIMNHGSEAQVQLVRDAITNGGLDNMADILTAIDATDAITYTKSRAADAATRAKQCLSSVPDSEYKTALMDIVEFAVDRNV